MADHVRVDYGLLEEAKNRLNAAGDLVNAYGTEVIAARELFLDGGAWQGEGREAFAQEYTETAHAHNALLAAMREAANSIDQIVQIMREAEEEAGR